MLNQDEIYRLTKMYKSAFKRANVDGCTLRTLEGYTITETKEHFKNNRKISVSTEVIPTEHYMNSITWIDFFHARLTKSYTFAGYIMTGMSYRSPDGTERVKVTWKIS